MATANESSNAFGEIVPQSVSASSSTPIKKVRYDVFINHRGPDTKETLAVSIYDTLHRMGLQVFLDKPELELGDSIPSEIEKAMTTSFLHIAILSPRYAESPWCLAELSFMLRTGNRIIPVFYNVDIGDIRWGKGIYSDAFSKHETSGRYSQEKLKDWRTALQKVTYLSGHIIKENDDEGKKKLLKAIKDYLEKQHQKIPLVVANHPVGLDEIVQDFERSVIHSSENVQIVGIVGMGGSGKTTLAKKYYNKTKFSIYKCSFIDNVRVVPKKDLHEKQKMMLQDLGFNGLIFDSVERGKAMLAEHLRSVKVFIILDDVDHQDQLESLLPMKDSLGQGSVIVVTSREFDVLTSWGISDSSIYKMKPLHSEHAMELFCRYAFQQPSPEDGFKSLVQNFLGVCKGLPLSLKVLGGLVLGKRQEYWDAQLDKVSRVLHKDIKDTLKVSFDALDEEEQEIFLDISCFFLGEEKDLAIAVWDGSGSGWSGLHSLEKLESKCLVELDERNRITMHDHLRDLGKEIATRKSPYRLWSPQQIREIEGQERVLIRGIKAETDEFCEKFMDLVREPGRVLERRLEILVVRKDYFTEELTTLSPYLVWLRYVNFLRRLFYRRNYFTEECSSRRNYFTEECSRLSEGLAWLRWDWFPHRSLPSWLSLKKLRILELHCAYKLEELWTKTADPPVELRELIISGATSFLRFPSSIGRLQHLKKISLSGYAGDYFEDLPEDFCRLQSLEHLELGGLGKLKSLPSKFGDLTNLRHLDLSSCYQLMTLPASFKQLIHLQYICLAFCYEFTFPPDILENMTKLETLNVGMCRKVQELPLEITNLVSLKKLDMAHTSIKELPNNIGLLSNLEELRIEKSLLNTLPASIVNLSYLTSLDISECPIRELAILPGRFSSTLCNLKSIKIFATLVSRISISPQCCPSLETLEVSYNKELVEIDSLPISVKAIKLENCEKLKELPNFTELVSLKELGIIQIAQHLKKIEGLEYCRKLEKLDISYCGEELHELPNFTELVSLKEFVIIETAEHLKKIEGLEYCRSLEKLIARTLWKVPVIQSLKNMESLRRLHLSADCNISALEPCLQTIKKEKWPSECVICGRTAPGVEAVLKNLTFPALTLLQSCGWEGGWLTINCGQMRSSNAAAMFCFVINTISSGGIRLWNSVSRSSYSRLFPFGATLKEGKWVYIGVLTQPSFQDLSLDIWQISAHDEKDMGMLAMGDKKRVVEAFYEVLQHLGKLHDTSMN